MSYQERVFLDISNNKRVSCFLSKTKKGYKNYRKGKKKTINGEKNYRRCLKEITIVLASKSENSQFSQHQPKTMKNSSGRHWQ
jgi:hypothetical protein